MQLVDYKVRVINTEAGTAAGVRVVIESRDEDGHLGHGRRERERDRSQLDGAGRQHRVQAVQGRRIGLRCWLQGAGDRAVPNSIITLAVERQDDDISDRCARNPVTTR